MNRIFINNKGQNLLEYTLLLGAVLAIIFGMSPLVKRSTQGIVKSMADQIGYQKKAEQFPNDQKEKDYSFKELFGKGAMTKSVATIDVNMEKRILEDPGEIEYRYDDITVMESTTDLNLGFQDKSR